MAVEFEEENYNKYRSQTLLGGPQTSKMTRWLVKIGIVKNERHANYILWGVFILSIIVIFSIIFFNPLSAKNGLPSGYKLTAEQGQLPRMVPR
ncbi:MAG: hypothetical protein WCG97_00795 [bacterium]